MCSVAQSCPALQLQGLELPRFLCPWDFQGKNTEVGKYWSGFPFPLSGDLPYLGIEPEPRALAGFFTAKSLGKPQLE